MEHDRTITLSVGKSRRDVNWQNTTIRLSELYEKLRIPTRGTEPMAEYLNLSKGQQDERKDVGGFVAGSLAGPRRKANAVTGRDIITLDLDSIPPGGTRDVLRRVEALGCGYCVYSTRKHMASAPRLRVLLPLDRTCTADEYEPCARYMAQKIGMELADPTTFEAGRLMYWPSVCADGEYIYRTGDKPPLSADGVLATYADWRDTTSWPASPGAASPARLAAKQGDPTAKTGVVGAFCRVYDVEEAMETFLPGIYTRTDTDKNRYTFTGGSTTGGAVLYDHGKFLYSHHATDPVGGQLVNAFDLVRLHRFGELDDEAAPGTPTVRLPSYTAMCHAAAEDAKVSALLLEERASEAGFEPVKEDDTGWRQKLKIHSKTGLPLSTIDNVCVILENDPNLKGKFALNEFASRGEVLKPLPWDDRNARRGWEDNDNQGLYWYLEKVYQITGTGRVDSALSLHSQWHAFNDVTTYLNRLKWDGVPRLDTLFIDYLGAADDAYTRAVTRKAFTAAVARAMKPGAKFDNMVILSGAQGIGKSTILDKMSLGWFNDSIRTFEGKEASELLQGVWIVEIAELDAFRRSDVARIKQFLSQRADRFRAAYGRHVKELPRRCVFFGTTNTSDYLQDKTGNRRFWPVDVGLQPVKKDVWKDLDQEIEQLWAEAVIRWKLGEPLYLDATLAPAAREQQENHRELDAREGLIQEFLEQPVPADWPHWSLDRRKVFWSGGEKGELELVPRGRVCALEIWCELLGRNRGDMRKYDAKDINDILESLEGWKRAPGVLKFGCYGSQRGFVKRPKQSPE